jgi:hypothetical protein
VPDPAAQTKWALQHLHLLPDGMPVEAESLDDDARLRVSTKEGLTNILGPARARAQTIPLRRRHMKRVAVGRLAAFVHGGHLLLSLEPVYNGYITCFAHPSG